MIDNRDVRLPGDTMGIGAPILLDFVRGDSTGLTMPAQAEALRAAGPDFLTHAFRAFGSLSGDNAVTRIRRIETFPGGNSGHKLFLSIEYAQPAPGLHEELFVKFSRDFADTYRDRRRYELEAEVRLASLSRLSTFPIRVPKAYFADFDHASGTGMLITEQIAFDGGEVEPLTPKCMDEELTEPLRYYRATITALARMAAAHKSGLLSPQAEQLFPFDPAIAAANDAIPWSETQLRDRLAQYADFAAHCPQLLPAHVTTAEFLARFGQGALRFQRHEGAIKAFLHTDPDLIALSHWNAHLDNAWFWPDPAGGLQCGLLDWGRVRQFNLAYALWGSLSGAGIDIWDNHLDELLNLFIDELHRHGGPLLGLEKLKLHLDLYIATIGLVETMNVPEVVLARLPGAVNAASIKDDLFREHEIPRVILHIFSIYLHLWDRRDFEGQLDHMLDLMGR